MLQPHTIDNIPPPIPQTSRTNPSPRQLSPASTSTKMAVVYNIMGRQIGSQYVRPPQACRKIQVPAPRYPECPHLANPPPYGNSSPWVFSPPSSAGHTSRLRVASPRRSRPPPLSTPRALTRRTSSSASREILPLIPRLIPATARSGACHGC
jgi:hypothetical protein